MSTIEDEVIKKINMLYLSVGYMDKYGADVWISVFICIIFTYLILSYSSANMMDIIRSDWDNQKCNPLVMPFAGFINKPGNKSNLEYTSDNFSNCINSLLQHIVSSAFQPFIFMISQINNICTGLMEAVKSIRTLFDQLRNSFTAISSAITNAISSIMISFISFMINIKDSMGKIQGILTTSLYTLFGSYMAMESLFLLIVDMLIVILIIIACMIIVFFAVAAGLKGVPIIGFLLSLPFNISGIITTIIMVLLLIPVIWIKSMMDRIMALGTPATPGVPSCFAENTPIETANGEDKPIQHIKLGEILKNGSKVTAVSKLSALNQPMYKLNNVFVTGEHRVYDPILKWIKVKYHPNSLYIPDFNEPYVYCLNTDKKEFTIKDTIFSDWDDIDEEVLANLKKNAVPDEHLPENFTLSDIHRYLDSGFHPNTPIVLADNTSVPISKIEINNVLLSGDKVLGIFQIDARDIDLFTYSFDNNVTLRATRNIEINDDVLGHFNCLDITNAQTRIKKTNSAVAYHLLTDTGFLTINTIRLHDYNYAIDKYAINKSKFYIAE